VRRGYGGATGVGRSHLANSTAFEAIKRGYRAVIRPTSALLAELHASRADGSYLRKIARLDLADLLALDDFGLRPLSAQGVDDLYETFSRRCERRCMITSDSWSTPGRLLTASEPRASRGSLVSCRPALAGVHSLYVVLPPPTVAGNTGLAEGCRHGGGVRRGAPRVMTTQASSRGRPHR
jgi:hypothetical protein